MSSITITSGSNPNATRVAVQLLDICAVAVGTDQVPVDGNRAAHHQHRLTVDPVKRLTGLYHLADFSAAR
jgi:hypothetical protein